MLMLSQPQLHFTKTPVTTFVEFFNSALREAILLRGLMALAINPLMAATGSMVQ